MKSNAKIQMYEAWKLPLALFTFFVVLQVTDWIPLKFWGIRGGVDFMDGHDILNLANCYKLEGNIVYSSNVKCGGFIYGKNLLKILKLLHIGPGLTPIVGYVFMCILAILIGIQLGSFSELRKNPFWLLIAISPPVLLLAERANFDVVMLALVIIASIIFSSGHEVSALVPLTLASLIKFYTLPLFLIFFLMNKRLTTKLVTLLTAAIVAYQVTSDLKAIKTSFPESYSWKFGMSIWPRYLVKLEYHDPGDLIDNFIGITFLALIVVLILIIMFRNNIPIGSALGGSLKTRTLFYLLFMSHLSCYVFGMNYDYRLVFIALASIVYLRWLTDQKTKTSDLLEIFIIIALWFTYPSGGFEPIGDLALEAITVYLGIRFLNLFSNDLKFQYGK